MFIRITPVERRSLFRLLSGLTGVLLSAWAMELAQDNVLFTYWRRTALVLTLGAFSFLAFLLFALTWTPLRLRLEKLLELPLYLAKFKKWNLVLFGLSVFGLAFLYLFPASGRELMPNPARIAAFWILSLLGAVFLLAEKKDLESKPLETAWLESLLVSLLVNGFVYKVLSYLGTIKAYPFSLNWSEATRYYQASLLLSKSIYAQQIPPFFQDFSRYVLEVIPFLGPVHNLFIARAWESFLWVGLNALTAWGLVRRFSTPSERYGRALLLFLFIFLFIFQGPIYYYLLPCVLIVLWGFDSRSFLRSIFAVILASIWAGISRINWIPIPAMLALTLYLLENPVNGKPVWKYLLFPLGWTVAGLAAAWPSRLWFMKFSEADPAVFNAAFDSPLFFYRLFPSSMYDWGVLPAALLMSAPALIIFYLILRKRWRSWHWIRLAGLGGMLLVLFAGGLIVSTKIGGGANLHNLDGYLALLTVTVCYLLLDHFPMDTSPQTPLKLAAAPLTFPWPVTFALIAVPLVIAVRTRYPILPAFKADPSAMQTVAALQKVIDESAAEDGDVLFITQRQLLTFGLIQNVPMVGGYDNVDLMEYAIMGYPPGLKGFYTDLENHRFKLIIAPYQSRVQTLEGSFAEESYSWYVYISEPLMKSYRVKAEFKDFDFLVLEPIH
jgi:hypothetical protein